MKLSIGIVGLPNVGKSTLFQALTKHKVNIANYPFTTIAPNVGVVPVPDERLAQLSKLVPQAAVLPAVIEVVDVAGLVAGAHKGEGLGNQFLSQLFPIEALLFLIRCFKDKEIVSVAEEPKKQLEILKEELLKKDEELKERAKKEKREPTAPRLSEKPFLTVCNIRSGRENYNYTDCDLSLDCKLELELSELTEAEKKELGESSKLPRLVNLLYKLLDLITFYTFVGGKELRAWPIKRGTLVPQAAGVVHTDFEKNFIRAEVVNWQKLLEAGGWQEARQKGFIKIEGKEYAVQDGDLLEVRHS
jgi:hypothetical protein